MLFPSNSLSSWAGGGVQEKENRVRNREDRLAYPLPQLRLSAERRSDWSLRRIQKLNEVWCFDEGSVLDVLGLNY